MLTSNEKETIGNGPRERKTKEKNDDTENNFLERALPTDGGALP